MLGIFRISGSVTLWISGHQEVHFHLSSGEELYRYLFADVYVVHTRIRQNAGNSDDPYYDLNHRIGTCATAT